MRGGEGLFNLFSEVTGNKDMVNIKQACIVVMAQEGPLN